VLKIGAYSGKCGVKEAHATRVYFSKFIICTWYVNDAKNDLVPDEFYKLCERVLQYRTIKSFGHQDEH